jgi:surface antigen
MRGAVLAVIALCLTGVSGCSSGSAVAPTPAAGAPPPAGGAPPAPAVPTGTALGGVLGGQVGASLTDDDRAAAWNAQVAALDSGQRRSWRGDHGVFGFIEPGAATGGGCRAYSQTIYIAGRPTRGRGVGCKQADGSWKMTS